MRAPRHRPRQRSPFLDLPSEIRNQIYKTALVSPSPVDLSPTKYMTTPEEFANDSETQRRYEAYKHNDKESYAELVPYNSESEIIFRIQSDLLHVRKHLATGLLGTCTQVYNEAANYFWGSNIWRFSGDEDWVGLYRFLLTIGPAARSRIHRLDVVATYATPAVQPLANYNNWQTKNHPKLHMAKLWFHSCRRYWPDCTDFVYELLVQEKSLRELNLLVPWDYKFKAPDGNENVAPLGFLPKVKLVVEAGGLLYGRNRIAIAGWDLLGLPGSLLGDTIDDGLQFWAKTTRKEQIWNSNLDYLTGVSQLFESEEISIHANGGRAHIPRKCQKVKRTLQAFGPCVIVLEDVDCACWRCHAPWYHESHAAIGTRYKSLVDVRDLEMLDWLQGFDL